jgi:hypothetical protein
MTKKKKSALPKKRFVVVQKRTDSSRETVITMPETLEYARQIADYHATKEIRLGRVEYVVRELTAEELKERIQRYANVRG